MRTLASLQLLAESQILYSKHFSGFIYHKNENVAHVSGMIKKCSFALHNWYICRAYGCDKKGGEGREKENS